MRPVSPAPVAPDPHAGERTRTSKGFRPTGPKPVAYASSATPARRLKDRAAGYQQRMADQEQLNREREQRERESRESDVTKFEEVAEEVGEERQDAAQRIGEELPPRDE
jgi:hypothetical protein